MEPDHRLSNQDELIESLDPDPVFDYLVQHGVMLQSSVEEINSLPIRVERNKALLQHLQKTGSAAVALFINALRQSGQLHLASSLDVEQRIKPVYGQGYWEKQRYKGQVTIMFQVVAAKVLVRKDSEEDKSTYITDQDVMMTPHKLKRSYENMITIPLEDHEGPKGRKILEYSYEEEEEEKSSWCRCFPFFCCSSKQRNKKGKKQKLSKVHQQQIIDSEQLGDLQKSELSLNHCDIKMSLPEQPSSPLKSGSTYFKSRTSSPTKCQRTESQTFSRKSDSLDRNSNHQLSELIPSDLSNLSEMLNTEVLYDAKSGEITVQPQSQQQTQKIKTKKKKKTKGDKKVENSAPDLVQVKNNRNESVNGYTDQDDNIPCIMDVPESKTPTQNSNTSSSPKKMKKGGKSSSPQISAPTSGMKRSETYELVERWKSEGELFEHARNQFCSFVDNALQGKIVRYFEQERRSLLLQVEVQECFSVSTLCMTAKQVGKLHEDYENGVLHENLIQVIQPQSIIDKMDCVAIHLRTVIDENDFLLALQELS